MSEKPSVAFGNRVAERRIELGWGQSELGREVGYNQRHISFIEGGGLKKPEKVVTRFARALKTSEEWLLHGSGTKGGVPPNLTAGELVDIYGPLDEAGKRALSELARKLSGAERHPH